MFGRLMCAVLGTIFLNFPLVFCLREMNFRDSGYVTYTLRSPQKTDQDEVFLLFRTIKPSGLLLHAAGQEDFLTLELLRGKIRYTSNLGSLSSGMGYHEVLVGDHLADNEWHQVEVKRRGMNLVVKVDREKRFSNITGKHSVLDIDGNIYVAGIDNDVEKASNYYRYFKFESFEGCLDDVTFNDVNILQLVYEKNSSAAYYGSVTNNCTDEPQYYPITFPNTPSYVKVKTLAMNKTDYNFKFRTYEGNGLLLMENLDNANGADISIALEEGRIKLDVNNPNRHVTQYAGQDLGDGLWHSLSVSIDRHRVRLTVDGVTSESRASVNSFTCATEVIVGAGGRGSDTKRLGFVGCMYDLAIQGTRVDILKEQRAQVKLDVCHLTDHCLPSPCKNRGRCIQQLNQTRCDCKDTDFTGKSCDVPAFEIANCAEWWAAGKRKSMYYKVNSRNIKPFGVYCDMGSEGNPKTVVQYEFFERNITASKGKITGSFYEHSIRYDIGEKEIEAIVKSSTHCKQFIQYRCYNSVLFDSPEKFNFSGRGARWTSRSGQIQDYWGSARPGSKSCTCGESGSCSEPSKSCNCDIADETWRSDEGYLSYKSDLPVTSLRFSVAGTSRDSYYRLGNLECFGSTKLPTTTSGITTADTSKQHQSPTLGNAPKSTKSTRTETAVTSPTSSPISVNMTNIVVVIPHTTSAPTVPASSIYSTSSPDDDPGPIVVIETPRKYITIRETSHQQLVTIVLSIVLVVFICAIVVLLVRQNILCPCKCLQMPVYEGVNNIELGHSTPLYNQTDQSEIVKYESSPYHSKDYDEVMVLRSGGSLSRWSPDMDSEAETDRLDISNGNSSDNSETSAGFQKQNDTQGKQAAPGDTFSPPELDLGTAKVIIDVLSQSLSKELDGNVRKPANKQSELLKTYVPFSNRRNNVQTNKQRRRMSISDDESVVDTSVSDPNNSSDSRLSINTRSWSDETVGDSENDEDIYSSASTQRQLLPNGILDKYMAYEGSNEYLSRENQFVEISQHATDKDPWVRDSVHHSSGRSTDAVKAVMSERKSVIRGKCKEQESEKEYSPCCREETTNKIVSEKLPNEHTLGTAVPCSKRRDVREHSLKILFEKERTLTTEQVSGYYRPSELKKDQAVFVETAKQRQAEGGETNSEDDLMSENTVICRHETEL